MIRITEQVPDGLLDPDDPAVEFARNMLGDIDAEDEDKQQKYALSKYANSTAVRNICAG